MPAEPPSRAAQPRLGPGMSRRGVLQGLGATAALGLAGGDAAHADVLRLRSTDAADMTAELNRRIGATRNGGTLRLPREAELRVDGTLRLHGRRDLVIDGNGALLYSTVVSPLSTKPVIPMFDVLGGTNIVLRDLRLRGTNPGAEFVVEREWQPLIDIRGTQGVLVSHVRAVGAWGDFVHIAPDTRPERDVLAQDVTLLHCRTKRIGRNQVSFTGCKDVLVQFCTFADTGYQVFDIEVQAPWWHARRLRMLDNVITGKVSLSVLVNAVAGGGVKNVEFARNVMESTPVSCEPPVNLLGINERKLDFNIHRNVLRTLSSAARVAGVEGFTFRKNSVTLGPGGGCRDTGTGIVAGVSSDILVERNDFFDGFETVMPASMVEATQARVLGNVLHA